MKKQTKGLIFTVIFGGSLLFWATAASFPGPSGQDLTRTGTPADNIPFEQRAQFCGTGEEAKSTRYVKEYKIPTDCTQPLAITTDPGGKIWFAQTNTGKIAKFDPVSESFTEYENPFWPQMGRSMTWGMDYSPDGSIWYTDEAYDSIWRFSIEDEIYTRLNYPAESDSMPQRLKVEGSQIFINDFTGNKLTFLDPVQTGSDVSYLEIPSPIPQSLTGSFAVDPDNNVWYTNWVFEQDGVLVRFDQDKYDIFESSRDSVTLAVPNYFQVFELPADASTINGITIGPEGKIWLADTSSSYFFSFDVNSEEFTKYITSEPPLSAYGNATGLIQAPASRPYWLDSDDSGRIVFNEQAANRLALFDPAGQSLVEYIIPSKNPNWADCEGLEDCGLAQVFDFAISGEKVWFTEWVENNIGVLDTSVPLPFSVLPDVQEITVARGQSAEVAVLITPQTDAIEASFVASSTAPPGDLEITHDTAGIALADGPYTATVSIITGESASEGVHKVLLGASTDDLTVSAYVTVNIVS